MCNLYIGTLFRNILENTGIKYIHKQAFQTNKYFYFNNTQN